MSPHYEYLRENAEDFLEEARRLLQDGKYKLAAFHTEQAVQLFLKYFLANRVGDFPKTHRLQELLWECGRECAEFSRVAQDYPSELHSLELAYIATRYLPSSYEKKEVEEFLRLAEKVRSLVYECLS
ncbi:MAG: DNA-binding protein [Thermodesulfatator sp.]|nr:MAG: DNA-binding protein [Thermodesulfatator sp.]